MEKGRLGIGVVQVGGNEFAFEALCQQCSDPCSKRGGRELARRGGDAFAGTALLIECQQGRIARPVLTREEVANLLRGRLPDPGQNLGM